MKTVVTTIMLLFLSNIYAQNPLISFENYETLLKEVKFHRAERQLSLDEFNAKSLEKNTVILDARSQKAFDAKHIKGAIHLDLTDFSQHDLDELFKDYDGRNTNVLIYCNNNFIDETSTNSVVNISQAMHFATKIAYPSEYYQSKKIKENELEEKYKKADQVAKNQNITLALNIPTYINLYGYGYKNVFELKELIDVNNSKIQFEGTSVKSKI